MILFVATLNRSPYSLSEFFVIVYILVSNGPLPQWSPTPKKNGDYVDRQPDADRRDPPKPIAICGMACRLPKGIKTPQELWKFLLAGEDARSKVPESRYNIEAFCDSSGKPGTTSTAHGFFLDENLAKLDT